ncbi:MAG: YqeG family HAD IIIA-type phosphatase [Bacilli bacterium]|nr:YqeG family HAD IIIA-type phosphatase [Bacilli bacterium]
MDWLFKTDYFIPDDYQKTVYDIDYAKLRDQGVKLLLIDLDNTLISYDETEPSDKIFKLFDDLRKLGFKSMIISNNHKKRVSHFASALEVPFLASAKKPLKLGFKKVQAMNPDIEKHEICVIGDQFMTDVLGAKRMRYRVIVVNAIKRKAEKWFTRINRKLEKRVLLRMKKRNHSIYQQLNLDEKR